MSYSMHAALRQYRQTDVASALIESDPRKLIEMLLAGAIDRLSHARGALMRSETAAKHHYISSSISIIEHLRLVIDLPAGGEIAQNLMRLYDYMLGRLPAANVNDDIAPLDEVLDLLREIKGAWNTMPEAGPRHH